MRKTEILLALGLSVMLIIALALSGCASKDNDAEDSTKVDLTKTYKFGLNVWGTTPILKHYGDEAQYTLETMGMTFSRASDDNKVDTELQNIQNFITEGVDALAIQAAGALTIPQIARQATAAKKPFGMYFFTGTPELRDELLTNEYYAGAVAPDFEADGKILAEQAFKNGAKTACIIGGKEGNLIMDNRAKGFRAGFEGAGGKIVAEERCIDNSETLAKAQSMFSASKGVNAVYIMGNDYAESTLKAMDDLEIKNCKVYLSAIDAKYAPLVKNGKISAGSGGTTFACNIGPTLVLNMLDGHAIKDKKNKSPFFAIPTSLITKDNVDAYTNVFLKEGAKPVTKEMIQHLCYRFNKDVTYDTYVNAIKNDFTVDAILKSNAK